MLLSYQRPRLIEMLCLGLVGLAGGCSAHKPRHSYSTHTAQAKETNPSYRQPPQNAIGKSLDITIPDVELLDQDGRKVRFYSDLVQGKTVAISFIFTSCTTICPALTALMSRVQQKLLSDGRSDIQLISISVDPVRDTPSRLKNWSKNFSSQAGWVFLTGPKANVDHLLKALRTFTPDPQDHTPMVLIGNEPHGVWKQVNGLSSADAIADAVRTMAGRPLKPQSGAAALSITNSERLIPDPRHKENESAHQYFGDLELQDQNGETHRLYADLMRGRVVLVNSFFSTCTGVCPVMARKIKDIRKAFPDRVGKDFIVLSISVDPVVDTPERLHEYAKHLRVGSGWYFLTGTKENVEMALHKFGMRVDRRENHSNLFLVGNDVTDSWKKLFSLAPMHELVPAVAEVLNNHPARPVLRSNREPNAAP